MATNAYRWVFFDDAYITLGAPMKLALRRLSKTLIVAAPIALAGCAQYAVVALTCDISHCLPSAHENFLDVINGDIGFSAQRSGFSWNRYPEWRGEIRTLSNGNEEYQYFWDGLNKKQCVVYWEVDKNSQRIIAARFDGTPDTCYLVP